MTVIKGYSTLSSFGLFMHFSQKLQHIGNKYNMFLIGKISGNLITALEFH